MRPSFRALLGLPPLALAAAFYLLARADRAEYDRELLIDPWPLAALDPSPLEETRRADQRWQARRQVTLALIDGRLTLRQAAAHFRDIDAELPEATRRRWRPPQYTEAEWPYRQVLNAVQVEFTGNRRAPAQAEEWVARLEAELREYLRQNAAPRLHRGQARTGGPAR
jgi:hypothetical protein